jgi:glycosyltransferase involved in cell wall biosynthesis
MDSHGFGGAELQLLSLAERLDRRRFEPVVIRAASPTEPPYFAERLRKLDIESHPAPSPLGLRHVDTLLRFARMLRRWKIDVFHAHKTYPPACRFGLLTAVLARCEVVISTDQLRSPGIPPRRQRHLLRLLGARMDGHIAVSTSLKRYLVQHLKFRLDKVRVIPNWVDPDLFAGVDRAYVRKELALSEDAMVIGCVARFHQQKGHPYLVTAIAELIRRHPSIRVLLIGAGITQAAVEAQVRRLQLAPYFHFLGQRDDVSALLAAIDIFVLPSQYEGLPVSVLEAMVSGKPVVATAVDGTVEAVDDGRTGLLVPPGDVAALIEALEFLIRRPDVRASMGAAGRHRVLQNFAAGPLVRQTEAMYKRGRR